MSDDHQKYLLEHYQELAAALLAGSFTVEQFAEQLTELHLQLERQASCDGLVKQFYNSNGFSQALEKWMQLVRRLQINGTLLALDIDELKRFNDTLGHIAGDKLIKLYAEVIDQYTRASDLKGRLGGDEFAVFLVGSNREDAQNTAEKIRTTIIQRVRETFTNLPWEQTISIGIAQVKGEDNALSLRQRADQALYRAKQDRNSVVILEDANPYLRT